MFKVGDIITGKKDSHNRYSWTNERSICEVIKIWDSGEIEVKVLECRNRDGEIVNSVIGSCFDVDARYFDLYVTSVTDDMIADENDVDSLLM